jgi:hypothetical protein
VANCSGLARDRAAKYQVAVRELAASRGWSVLPPKASIEGVSANPVETGVFFERHFDAAFLEAGSGDEVLMAAAPERVNRWLPYRIPTSDAAKAFLISLPLRGRVRDGGA